MASTIRWFFGIVLILSLTFAATACTQAVGFRSAETAISGKRAHLDGRKVYVAEPKDTRAERGVIGGHYNEQTEEAAAAGGGPARIRIMDYKAEVPVTQEVRTSFEKALEAGGAQIVYNADDADFRLQVEIEKFNVDTNAFYHHDQTGMVTSVDESTEGVVTLKVAILDAKGFEVGADTFEANFSDTGDQPQLLAVNLNKVVADVVDSEAVVKVASAAGPQDVVADAGGEGEGEDGATTDAEALRVYLRYDGDRKLSKILVAKGVYFQGPILERGGIEFAGTSEMDEVYKSLCSEMGVGAEEERKCRLQAARRIFVQEIIELSARQPQDGIYEVTMEVWNPETNGMISAKGIKLPAASFDDAAEQALAQLACVYLKYRGDDLACQAGALKEEAPAQ